MRSGEVSFSAIVELIGIEASDKLLMARCGRSIYIPKNSSPNSPLTQIVGEEDARRLGERLGPCEVSVPILKAKRLRVAELKEKGLSVPQIAAEMRCTERTIYNILSEFRDAGPAEAPQFTLAL